MENEMQDFFKSVSKWFNDTLESGKDLMCASDLLHDWNPWVYTKEGSCLQERSCKRCGKEDNRVGKHHWGTWGPSQKRKTRIFYINRIKEINSIFQKYREDEIKTICAVIGIEYENLEGNTKRRKITELIIVCSRNARLKDLNIAFLNAIEGLSDHLISRIEEINIDLQGLKHDIDNGTFDWAYDPSLTCQKDRRCQRCGEIESKEHHIWGVAQYRSSQSCEKVRYCKCCGVQNPVRETFVDHNWGEWKYEYPNQCTTFRKCDRCGTRERDNIERHQWSPWRMELGVNDREERFCRRCGKLDYRGIRI